MRKLLQLYNSLEMLLFGQLYFVTKILPDLDRFYSILATVQYFRFWKSAIMDQFVTFHKKVYNVFFKEKQSLFLFKFLTKQFWNKGLPLMRAQKIGISAISEILT